MYHFMVVLMLGWIAMGLEAIGNALKVSNAKRGKQ